MNKILKISLAFAALCFMLMCPVYAYAYETTGSCGAEGDNVTYSIVGMYTNNYKITISGTGAMADYSGAEAPYISCINDMMIEWIEATGMMEDMTVSIVIDPGVTRIGSCAFANNLIYPACWDINMPDTVESIGANAFEYCNFTEISIPNSVKSIDDYAFKSCNNLTSVTIPASVIFIGKGAFYGIGESTEINVAEDNKNYSFADGVLFDKNKTTLVECLTYKSGSYTIPNTVISISDDAFNGCSELTSVTIPSSVVYIGDYAFAFCSKLTSIDIPSSVDTIDSYAFYYCNGLTSVTIPNSVKTIDSHAFDNCKSLTSAVINGTDTSIGSYAFYNCEKLTSVDINGSVTSIGYCAFCNCKGLTTVNMPDSITSIEEQAFSGCTSLTDVNIPKSLTAINNNVFYGCVGLTSITIPDSVTSIGSSAFSGCTGLTSVTIPDSVTSIGGSAFYNCTGLYSVTIPDSVTVIGSYAFSGCTGLTSFAIPNTVEKINNYTFYGCTGLKSVTIPDSVTYISIYAFYNCSGLEGDLTIPTSVTSISNYAFAGCTNLNSITVLNKDAAIGTGAFNNVQKLRCFQNSKASSFTASSGAAPKIVYIQEQGSLDISIPKLDDGKWIQKVEIVVHKGDKDVTQELTYFRDNGGDYIFPTDMTADVYLGGDVSLPYDVYYYYNYDQVAATDFTNCLDASEDNGTPNDKTQLYRKTLETATPNVDIRLVELGEVAQ